MRDAMYTTNTLNEPEKGILRGSSDLYKSFYLTEKGLTDIPLDIETIRDRIFR